MLVREHPGSSVPRFPWGSPVPWFPGSPVPTSGRFPDKRTASRTLVRRPIADSTSICRHSTRWPVRRPNVGSASKRRTSVQPTGSFQSSHRRQVVDRASGQHPQPPVANPGITCRGPTSGRFPDKWTASRSPVPRPIVSSASIRRFNTQWSSQRPLVGEASNRQRNVHSSTRRPIGGAASDGRHGIRPATRRRIIDSRPGPSIIGRTAADAAPQPVPHRARAGSSPRRTEPTPGPSSKAGPGTGTKPKPRVRGRGGFAWPSGRRAGPDAEAAAPCRTSRTAPARSRHRHQRRRHRQRQRRQRRRRARHGSSPR